VLFDALLMPLGAFRMALPSDVLCFNARIAVVVALFLSLLTGAAGGLRAEIGLHCTRLAAFIVAYFALRAGIHCRTVDGLN